MFKPKHLAILDYLNSQDTLKTFRSGSGGEFPDTPDIDSIEESNNQEKGKSNFMSLCGLCTLALNRESGQWFVYAKCSDCIEVEDMENFNEK
jgi:hypothetical protein|tara:strand:+ start:1002 stop:1277 length:276 start_codon:yes stop_codon:yes gene_type:complete